MIRFCRGIRVGNDILMMVIRSRITQYLNWYCDALANYVHCLINITFDRLVNIAMKSV